MLKPIDRLRNVAAAMSGQPDWGDLMAAMKGYVDQTRDECIDAPLESLQGAQGRARGVRDLHKLLSEAREVNQQIADRRR